MDVEFYQEIFSASVEVIIWFLIFSLKINVVDHIDWSVDIEPSLHPWDKSPLIMVYDPFQVIFF